MLFTRLAQTWQALAATRSRLAKREVLVGLLTEAADPAEPAEQLEIVISYLSGSLRQRRTGVGWRSLAEPPSPADEPSLTVVEVDAAFAEMACLAGPGSAAARTAAVGELFARASETEQQLLRGLVFGELRQGALEAAVQDGLAAAFEVPLAAVRRASMLLGSTADSATRLQRGGLAGLERVGLRVGTPVQPMLAASAADVGAALDKSELPAVVDSKLDGIRVQVHKSGSEVRIFTRSLDEITERLPEVVASVRALPFDLLVLDGEALALRPDGRPESFQVIASRAATHAPRVGGSGVGGLGAEVGGFRADVADHGSTGVDEADAGGPEAAAPDGPVPLRAYFFDLLRLDDRDLLDEPLTTRIEAMTAALPAELIVPRTVAESAAEVTEAFERAVGLGFEGVVVKNPQAPYAAGRRDSAWIKLKPRHTFDLVVTAAEWGHGRRQGWLSNLHLAARDATSGELVMLGKTFKGLTDQMLAWQTERFLELQTRRTQGTVYLRPEIVAEIAVDGLQRSTRYPGGVALRFARVLRYREDKTAAEADTLQTVVALLS